MSYAKWLDHMATGERSPRSRYRDGDRKPALRRPKRGRALRSDDPNAGLELPGEPAALRCGVRRNASPQQPRPIPTFLPAVEYFRAGTNFSIGDIDITPFTIPHDAADPCGFVFEAEGIRMALATDLGYMPPNVKQAIAKLRRASARVES